MSALIQVAPEILVATAAVHAGLHMALHPEDSALLQAALDAMPENLFMQCWTAFLRHIVMTTGEPLQCSDQDLHDSLESVKPLFAMLYTLGGELLVS
jgi:hypothetical protein